LMIKKYKKLLTRLSVFLVICIGIKSLFFRDIQTINKTYHGYYIDNVTKENLGECNIEIRGIRRKSIVLFDEPLSYTNSLYVPLYNGIITIDGSNYLFNGIPGIKDGWIISEDSGTLLGKNSIKKSNRYGVSIYNDFNELYFSTSEEYNKELVWASTKKLDNFNDILDNLPIYYGKK